MKHFLHVSLVMCSVLLPVTSAIAQTNNNNKTVPAKGVVRPRTVARPPMTQQMRRPGQVPRRSVARPGLNNPAARGNNGIANRAGAQQAPRSQLYEMVKPVGPVGAPHPLATATAIKPTHMPAAKPGLAKTSFTKPAHIAHNPAHRIGSAGARFDHRRFAFRRDGFLFHRNYYILGGVWYWYDAPFVETDPDYTLVDDGTLPVCDPDADECQ